MLSLRPKDCNSAAHVERVAASTAPPPPAAQGESMTKWVYFFGGGKADGKPDMKDLLGGKGANLAEMSHHRHPRPARLHHHHRGLRRLLRQRQEAPAELAGRRSRPRSPRSAASPARSSATRPTRCSSRVRSGARASMPGMMNTILNLGLTDATVEGLAKKTGNARFAYDSYRRLIAMFGSSRSGVDHEPLRARSSRPQGAEGLRARHRPRRPTTCKELVGALQGRSTRSTLGKPFPQDPDEQLWGAINAVFNVLDERPRHRVPPHRADPRRWGTAVNVQAMVFGNMGDDLGHRRRLHPRPEHRRERLLRRLPDQRPGRGRRRRHPHAAAITERRCRARQASMETEMPKVYDQLMAHPRRRSRRTTRRCRTSSSPSQDGTLYMLQTRTGKRTGTAAVRIAVEMAKEGLIDETTAVKRVDPGASTSSCTRPRPQGEARTRSPAASPPAPAPPSGKIVLSADAAVAHAKAPGRADHPRPQGDQPRGHRRHAPRQGHPDRDRRQDQPRGRRRPRLGQALRRRLRRHPRSTTPGRHARSPAARRSRPATILTINGTTGDVHARQGRRSVQPRAVRRLRRR